MYGLRYYNHPWKAVSMQDQNRSSQAPSQTSFWFTAAQTQLSLEVSHRSHLSCKVNAVSRHSPVQQELIPDHWPAWGTVWANWRSWQQIHVQTHCEDQGPDAQYSQLLTHFEDQQYSLLGIGPTHSTFLWHNIFILWSQENSCLKLVAQQDQNNLAFILPRGSQAITWAQHRGIYTRWLLTAEVC